MNLLKNIRERIAAADDASAVILNAPVSGQVMTLEDVNDPTFTELVDGDGFAIVPEEGVITAPADAVIESVAHTRHAISMRTESGVELMIHVGLNTVELDGKFFNTPVAVGDRVKTGDTLIEVDLAGVKNAGYDTTTPVVVTNTNDYAKISVTAEEAISQTPFMVLSLKTKTR